MFYIYQWCSQNVIYVLHLAVAQETDMKRSLTTLYGRWRSLVFENGLDVIKFMSATCEESVTHES